MTGNNLTDVEVSMTNCELLRTRKNSPYLDSMHLFAKAVAEKIHGGRI